jgi:galactokinase
MDTVSEGPYCTEYGDLLRSVRPGPPDNLARVRPDLERRRVNVAHVIRDYAQVFGAKPAVIAHAPGRVNLIGEHVDYNGGPVLPFAIDRRVVVAAAAEDSGLVSAHSASLGSDACFPADASGPAGEPAWENYLRGMVAGLRGAGVPTRGATLWIGGDLAPGSGLSSSAALCVAVGYALAALADADLSPERMAGMAQAAEHDFAGTPCGIMDQYAACFGRAGHALLLDCRDLTRRQIPFTPAGLQVLVIPSGVKRSLANGAYEERVHACREVVGVIAGDHPHVKSLRDVTPEMLDAYRHRLSPVLLRRARHVVTEIARVNEAVEAMTRHEWIRLGQLLWETQDSLREDYEVSCRQIDDLISLLRGHDGVLGARMMGGGFGGVVLALVTDTKVEAVTGQLIRNYYGPRDLQETVFSVRPGDGAASFSVA